MTFAPTEEQEIAEGMFLVGESFSIRAGAGTGKTSTLELLARSTKQTGTYVAYNRSIATAAADRFPMTVQARTVHSIAARAMGGAWMDRVNADRVPGWQLAKLLDLRPLVVSVPSATGGRRDKKLAAGFLAGLVMKAVQAWCYSAEPEPSGRFVPFQHGLDLPGRRGNNEQLQAWLDPFVVRAWEDISDEVNGRLPVTHDHYLKAWTLDTPRIPGEYILVDEAQDLNPCMLTAITYNAAAGKQVVLVGDPAQQIYCQPVGTMVRVNVGDGRTSRHVEVPIESLNTGDRVVTWSRNWRNGGIRKTGCAVSSVSSRHHDGRLIVAEVDGRRSRYTPEHHCVAVLRDALDGQHVVYMMRRGDQYRVGRSAWRHTSQHGANGPHRRSLAEGADAFWILSTHESAQDAALAEALTQTRWGMPSLCFRRGPHDLVDVDTYWDKIGSNRDQAAACLSHFGRLIEHPLWTAGSSSFGRGPVVTVAANLMSGMRMLAADNALRHGAGLVTPMQCWTPAEITDEWYSGPVISISVDTDHTYIADGIVTHNSWRGSIDAMTEIGYEECQLSKSWRFGPAIAEVANRMLAELGAPLRLTGNDEVESSIGPCTPAAILCRGNVAAMDIVLARQAAGGHPHLIGGGEDVLRFAKGVSDLQAEGRSSHPDLACFDSWEQVKSYTEEDPTGSDLSLMVHMIEEYGLQIVIDALDGMVAEREADLIVSTVHRAKGREWSTVKIAADFTEPDEARGDSMEERRLLYVAATRAQHVLDLRSCEPLVERYRGWR